MYKVIHCTTAYENKDKLSVTIRLPRRYFWNEADIYVQI